MGLTITIKNIGKYLPHKTGNGDENIKQPDVTRNGPQCPSGTAWPLPIIMGLTGNGFLIHFLFLEIDKKT